MNILTKCLSVIAVSFFCCTSTVAQEAIWASYVQGGFDAYNKGDYGKSEQLFRAALREAEKLNSGDKTSVDRRILSLNGLSVVLEKEGKYAEAEKSSWTLIELMESSRTEDDPEFAIALNNLGLILSNQKKFEEAEKVHLRALALREKYEGRTSPNVAVSLLNLGKLFFDQDKYTEAEALFNRAQQLITAIPYDEINSEQLSVLMICFNNLTLVYMKQKRYAEAESRYKLMITLTERLKGVRHPNLIGYLEDYAKLLRLMKRDTEAVKLEYRARIIARSN